MTPSQQNVLETEHITKRFGHLVANDDISIVLKKGEILAILGENGAGKTTLMNILFGLYRPTSGAIKLNGVEENFRSPREAIAAGLGMVHQHFMLVPPLTVTQNIILGQEPVKNGHILYDKARKEVTELSTRFGLEIDPDARVMDLPVGLQQRVEILKALYRKASVLILDEPTAVLSPREVEELFDVLKKLAASGTSIIIITHKLEEALSIANRVYVLRRGKLVAEMDASRATPQELANQMVGRPVVLEVEKPKPLRTTAAAPILNLEKLCVKSQRGVPSLVNVDLSVRNGEILGIAGVEGNGQDELCKAVMGLCSIESGSIRYKDKDISHWNSRRRIGAGIGYIPEDRHSSGLVLPFTLSENLILGKSDAHPLCQHGILNKHEIEANATRLMQQYDIRAEYPATMVSTLSGGNQQKVVVAREFSRNPQFLLISQPTRGLDVGAIEYIYRKINELKVQGVGILLISMELEEIFAIADRIAVLHKGEVVFESPAQATDEAEIGEYMFRGKLAGRVS
jgi:simple sugar transport system ATP-binding protein